MNPQPEEIERRKDGSIRIRWSDGHEGVYEPRYLRLNCRCAACVEEWSGRQIVKAGDIPADLKPLRISPVGQYALHVEWSDGHSTGIYPFGLLRSICPCKECRPDGGDGPSME